MKYTRQNLTMLSAVLAFAGCRQNPPEKKSVVKEATEVPATQDTVAAPSRTVIEGKVLEVQNGKDGYTAKIETANKEIFFATISHSNLKDHTQYKTVTVGESLKVTGDFWKAESENHITVREIQ